MVPTCLMKDLKEFRQLVTDLTDLKERKALDNSTEMQFDMTPSKVLKCRLTSKDKDGTPSMDTKKYEFATNAIGQFINTAVEICDGKNLEFLDILSGAYETYTRAVVDVEVQSMIMTAVNESQKQSPTIQTPTSNILVGQPAINPAGFNPQLR